tara:strand:- start:77301 stop:77414 length:114 start_codon:yes stop_codon:yes gene_type:complete
MKKLFENFRSFVNEELTDADKKRKKELEGELEKINHK